MRHLTRLELGRHQGLAQSLAGLQVHSSLTRAPDTEKMASTCWPLASLQYLGVRVAAEVWLDLVLRYSLQSTCFTPFWCLEAWNSTRKEGANCASLVSSTDDFTILGVRDLHRHWSVLLRAGQALCVF